MKRGQGRPSVPEEEKVLPNGLLPRQWERVKSEAKKRGYQEAAPFLRWVIDDWIAKLDAEEEILEPIEERK